jgi:hypothetical protein
MVNLFLPRAFRTAWRFQSSWQKRRTPPDLVATMKFVARRCRRPAEVDALSQAREGARSRLTERTPTPNGDLQLPADELADAEVLRFGKSLERAHEIAIQRHSYSSENGFARYRTLRPGS